MLLWAEKANYDEQMHMYAVTAQESGIWAMKETKDKVFSSLPNSNTSSSNLSVSTPSNNHLKLKDILIKKLKQNA